MRIAIFSENLLSNSGGAEVYALKLAEVLCKQHEVELFTVYRSDTDIESVYKKYNTPYFQTHQIRKKTADLIIFDAVNRFLFWIKLKKKVENRFDFYINASCNRMLGFSGIKSIHLIHFPVQPYSKIFKGVIGKYLDNLYCKSYWQIWANSEFTRKYIQEWWNLDSIVLNPPIDMKIIPDKCLKEKENRIIVVGRLVPDKKIKELAEAFLEIKDLLKNYILIIIGNKDNNYIDYYNQLKIYEKTSNSYIRILSDVSYETLVSEYRKAKLFWHGKGLDVDESNPLLMEHFGMTTVEAMANGCIPIVINKAGQKEIVEEDISGFLWNSISELKEKTQKIINDENLLYNMSKNTIERSKKFLLDEFTKKVGLLIK